MPPGNPDIAPPTSGSKFIELDVLRSATGVKGTISQRVSNGAITFSIVREFERDGITDWTTYFSEVQFDDYQEMLDLVKERIAELRKDPKVAPLRLAGGRR